MSRDFLLTIFQPGEISTKKVPVNLSSHPLGSKYKSAITEQYNKGQINFGGHYIVVLWGDGAGLSLGVMVDVLNGKIYKLPLSYENSCRGTYHDQNNNILYHCCPVNILKNRGTIIELPPVMSTFELPHKKERHG